MARQQRRSKGRAQRRCDWCATGHGAAWEGWRSVKTAGVVHVVCRGCAPWLRRLGSAGA